MKILVLGGDGYLGWPTALHLSERGHDVAVADNFARRQYDYELGAESLVPIEPLQTRIAAWRDVSGKRIGCYIGDLCDAEFTYRMLAEFRPDAIVHFGEQRAACLTTCGMRLEAVECGAAQDAVYGVGEQSIELVTLHSVSGLIVFCSIWHHITCL